MLNKLLSRLTVLVFFIFIVQITGIHFHWFYLIWWFDMPMHFLGGVFIGLLLVFLIEKNIKLKFSFPTIEAFPLLSYILLIALIGILWEYFELIIDVYTGNHLINILDTFSDISFDIAGGALSLLYIGFRYPFFRKYSKDAV